MKLQWFKRLLTFALALILSIPALALPATAVETDLTLASDKMTVVFDKTYPAVLEYRWGATGKVLYGHSGTLTQVKINSNLYTPTVIVAAEDATAIVYTLSFAADPVKNVVIKLRFSVTNNILEMRATEITDPDNAVRYLEFPDQSLISVRSTQAGAAMAYNSNFANGDKYSTVTDKAVDANPIKVGHVFLYTNDLAATLESNMTCQYNYLQTRQLEDYKETSVRTIDFMYRGPDNTITELPWCKVAVTDDCNASGTVDWQDAAVAYRDIMDPLTGENLARKTIGVNILLNYWGRQAWTWDNGLDHVLRQAQATDDFPQLMLIKGSHNQYGDGWPSYGDANPLLGGNAQLNWLKAEAEKHNIYVGTHTNSVEGYPESPFWPTTPKYPGSSWDLVDRGGSAIDDIEYWTSGMLSGLYDRHETNIPGMKFHYLDVSAGRWDGRERRWTTYKTLQKYKEKNWSYFTEMYLGYVNYTLNDTSTAADSAKYVNWCHTYYFGEENDGGNHGNSDLRRFVANDQTIYEAGTARSQNVLGRGYQQSYGDLGWSESQKTVEGMVSEFWQHSLADTYLKNFPVLRLEEDSTNNNHLTAWLAENVKSVYDGTNRIITKNNLPIATLNDETQDIFIPWEPTTEEKIYTYSTVGGEITRTLPASWSGVTSVEVYALDETNGRTLAQTLAVSNNTVTINYTAKQGYVVAKAARASVNVAWGDGQAIKDGNFNSNAMALWTTTDHTVAIANDAAKGNYYLKMTDTGSAKQEITVESGKTYVVSALARTDSSRKGTLSVTGGNATATSTFLGHNTTAVMGNVFNNWTMMKTYFTATSTTATVTLTALDGAGALLFDDVRIYEEDNPYGKGGHYYFEDFETAHNNMGGFVHMTDSLARLAYDNPFTGIDTAGNTYTGEAYNKAVDAGCEGEVSVMMGGRNNSKMKTLPSTLRLEPNTGYDLSFVYKASYGPANGWKFTVQSEQTNEVLVNKYLSGFNDQIQTATISFRTGAAEDYIITIENAYAQVANKADLIVDNVILDINESITENLPLDEDVIPSERVYAEAEDGTMVDCEKRQNENAYGGMVVSNFKLGGSLAFDYMNGAQTLTVKYQNTTATPAKFDLYINGVKSETTVELPVSESFTTLDISVVIPNAGQIKLVAQAETLVSLDYLVVIPVYEAENAKASGYTGSINEAKASGGKLMWINNGNNQGSALSFEIKADAHAFAIRHTNEKGTNRTLDIYLNGMPVALNKAFEPTGARYTFADVRFDVPLKKGDTLKLAGPANVSNVAMIDCVTTIYDESKVCRSASLDKTQVSFEGQTHEQLTVIFEPAGSTGGVAWSSDHPEIVTVKKGLLIPVSTGTAKISCTVDNRIFLECAVTVEQLPQKGTKFEAEECDYGSTVYVSGTTADSNGQTAVWLRDTNWSTNAREDAYLKATADAAATGILVRWANEISTVRTLDVFVDEHKLGTWSLPRTGDKFICVEEFIPADIKNGSLITFRPPEGENNAIMVDCFTLMSAREKAPITPETTPNIVIHYETETLTGFAPAGSYTIGGAAVSPAEGVLDAKAYIGQAALSIIRKGNGATTSDSAAQSLTVPARPAAPAGVGKTDTSTLGVTDGTLTGVSTAMEYSTDSVTWSSCEGVTVNNLAAATYYVRTKAVADNAFASQTVALTVASTGVVPDPVPPYNPPTNLVTKTEQNEDGSTTKTVTNKRTGEVIATTTHKDGTKIVATTPKGGSTTAKVTLPADKKSVTVTIPLKNVTPGTVAIIVHADGTEELVKVSVATKDGIKVLLKEGATLRFKDNTKTFADARDDAWYADAVAFVTSRELFNGVSSDRFASEVAMNRAMFTTVLHRLSGDKQEAGEIWYSAPVDWAKKQGISDGSAPEAEITRESLAVMLYRYAKAATVTADLTTFSDGANVSDWAVDAMNWAVKTGIIEGRDGALDPNGSASRAEVATMLQRFVAYTMQQN